MIESDFLDLLDEAQRVCGRDAVDLAGYLGARLPNADTKAREAAVEAIFRYTGSRPTLPARALESAEPVVKQSGQIDGLSTLSLQSLPNPPGTDTNPVIVTHDAEGREISPCTVCGKPLRIGEQGCIFRVVPHEPTLAYHPFIPYFDVALGKQINSWAERWTAMKGEPDEDYGRDQYGNERPGVLGRPRLEYRDHPSKGELSARRDKVEHHRQEQRRGHRP